MYICNFFLFCCSYYVRDYCLVLYLQCVVHHFCTCSTTWRVVWAIPRLWWRRLISTIFQNLKMSESKKTAMSSLDLLKASGTLVVADTGDFEVTFLKSKSFKMLVKFLEILETFNFFSDFYLLVSCELCILHSLKHRK